VRSFAGQQDHYLIEQTAAFSRAQRLRSPALAICTASVTRRAVGLSNFQHCQ
jgi:hypothetical protein